MLRAVRDWWFLRRVLRALNRVRAEHGFEPLDRLPKGHPGAWTRCPVSRALSVMDYGGPIVDRFGERFDAGDFPQLVA